MKITSAKLFEYRLPLKQPVQSAGRPLSYREGLLVKITSETGLTGWGEAAPLEGFSSETLAEARSQLALTLPELVQATIPLGMEQLNGGFEDWLSRFQLPASVRCAIEMAVLNLIAADRTVLLASLLSPLCPKNISVNGLIVGTGDEAIDRARLLIKQGYSTLKLKVGRTSLQDEVKTVNSLSRILTDEVSLRLDANRAWSLAQALQFARGTEGCNIEYIEEPVSDFTAMEYFNKETSLSEAGLPLALDETTREIDPEDIANLDYIAAVVLKPTLLGGFERAAEFARAASKLGAKVVVTSTFESPIGIAALAHFAAAYGTEKAAAGLETINWFQQQLVTTPISITDGKIILAQATDAAETIDMSLLSEVDLGKRTGERS